MNMPDAHEYSNTTDTNALAARVAHLEDVLNKILLSDKYLFQKPLIGGPNGLRLGSMAKDKVGFFNIAPVAQYATHFASSAGATYGNTEQNIINFLQAALKTYGLIIP